MTRGLRFWRRFVEPACDAAFGPLGRFLDKRRRKASFQRPVISGHGRDALRYYEQGHYVVIQAELMYGDLERLVFPNRTLKWDGVEAPLADEEAARVMRSFCAELDRQKIRWALGGG